MRHRGTMTTGNLLEGVLVRRIRALGQGGTLEQLVRDALERRDDRDHRLAPPSGEQDAADVTDGRRRRQGGAAKLEYFHWCGKRRIQSKPSLQEERRNGEELRRSFLLCSSTLL